MIFKIADGRTCFYQWDIDRQIIVSDPTIKEVHFCNRTDVCSLVVEVVDGVANVPNKVLQSGFDVRVFGYDGKATMHEATFKVKARTKPTDYVYTEVEIKQYSDLEVRIDEIEKNSISEEVIISVVNNYLDENPITMDGYATEEYVNEAVSNVKVDVTGLATETYVDEAVKKVKPDLTDYAKKTDIPDVSDFISEIPSEYVTESELEAKGYAKASALNDKANANHTHSEYAKTNHTHSTADVDGLQKALNDKATQADIDKAIELHDHRYDYAPIDHTHGDEYAAKSHTHSYNNLLDKPTIPSVEGLATEKYVDAAIANIEIPEGTGGAGTPLYQHTVYIGADGKFSGFRDPSAYATFVCDRAEEFTFESFVNYLNTTGATLAISGTIVNSTSTPITYPLDIMKANNAGTGLVVSYRSTTDSSSPRFDTWTITSTELTNFTDTVSIIGTASISGGGESADLSNYYTKEETYSKAEVDGLIPEPTDLTNYYTKDETTQAIQDALNAIGVAEGGAY